MRGVVALIVVFVKFNKFDVIMPTVAGKEMLMVDFEVTDVSCEQ